MIESVRAILVTPDRTLLTISRPHDLVNLEEAMRIRAGLVTHVRSETRIRSAACALLRVADGTLDSYVSVSCPSGTPPPTTTSSASPAGS